MADKKSVNGAEYIKFIRNEIDLTLNLLMVHDAKLTEYYAMNFWERFTHRKVIKHTEQFMEIAERMFSVYAKLFFLKDLETPVDSIEVYVTDPFVVACDGKVSQITQMYEWHYGNE